MIDWDAPCKALNCEHLYYVYGCEANCALKCACDKIKEYANIRDKLERAMSCCGCKNVGKCNICSRNYSDMYSA